MDGIENVHDTRWIEVLAKATALLALQGAHVEGRLEQADFLQALGVTRPEAARMLGVSPITLRTLAHAAKKGGPRVGKDKAKR